MTDLIERLLDKQHLRATHGLTGWVLAVESLHSEAADEIKRLTAERDEHFRWRGVLAEKLFDCEAEISELRRQLAEPKRVPLTDEQIEAQIEARDALLDFISENGTASEGVQHYLDRYVRAALAAKDNGNAGE